MRQIKLTAEQIERVIEKIRADLKKNNMRDGELNISERLDRINGEHAKLIFSAYAWMKTLLLLTTNKKEVGWHFVVSRQSAGTYRIENVLVYPQTVAAATVNTDQKKYEEWIDSLDDDTFAKLKGHAHSHVNMSVSPSGVDVDDQRAIIDQLTGTSYYVFMIMNKQFSYWARIYDAEANVVYETDDIDIIVEGGADGLLHFLDESKKMVMSSYTSPYWTDRFSNETFKDALKKEPAKKKKKTKKDDEEYDYGGGLLSDEFE